MKQIRLIAFLALCAFACQGIFGETYSGSCGENVTWILDTSTGVLTISGTGEMRDYFDYRKLPWHEQRTSVRTVIINKGVTSIGQMAFSGCSSLASITIPDGVTSIGRYAFDDCTSLASTTIPASVTSIGDHTFCGCSSLSSMSVAQGNPKYDSRGNCNAIIETASNTLIAGCKATTIPEGVTSIEIYAFYGCSSLSSINIPASVTSIGAYAFRSCSSLTSINIPASVTSIGDYAFSFCSSLTSITIPEGVTSIGEFAFSGCSSLASITFPEGLTSIGYGIFNGCNKLPVENGLRYADTYLVETIDKTLNSYQIKSGTKYIGRGAFSYCSSLTSITIPEGVTSIGDDAFWGCSGLTSITIPESVTSIGSYAFQNCSGLTSITIPEGVTSIGEWAFDGCSSLSSITIPKNVRSVGKSAFSSCPSIKSVTVCGSRPPICEGKIFDDAVYNDATLYVPVGTSTLFYVSTGWMNFWNITETDTKVSATEVDETIAPIYDLSGRRIDAADAVHGIYIQNGKKVYKR